MSILVLKFFIVLYCSNEMLKIHEPRSFSFSG